MKLKLTNKAWTTDIVFRLFNESGIPMAGRKVRMFTLNPTENPDSVPVGEATVSFDGRVSFSGIRRGARYYIQLPDGRIMTIDVPAQMDEEPKVILADGTMAALTADYPVTGATEPEQQWTLTVRKVTDDGKSPLAGATIGLYADAACETLIKTDVSAQDGTIAFSGLIKGQGYWLRETAAPNGYQLNTAAYEGKEEDTDVIIENTLLPADSGTPDIPGNPDNSGTPGGPGNSDNSGTSGSPGAPGEPGAPENSRSGGISTDDADIPQTGDPLPLLIAAALLSGILLTAMMLYRFWGVMKPALFDTGSKASYNERNPAGKGLEKWQRED